MRRLILAAISVVILMAGVIGLSKKIFADDENTNNFTFYRISSAAASYYDEAHNPTSDFKPFAEQYPDNGSLNMTNAGAFLGFIDTNLNDGMFGSIVSWLSNSQVSYGYGSFTEWPIEYYAYYGRSLMLLGLDTVDSSFGGFTRAISGGLLWIGYVLCTVPDLFFEVAIKVLQIFNPFSWFTGAIDSSKLDINTPNPAGGAAAFQNIRNFIADWYITLSDMGFWVVSLMFIASLAAVLLLWNVSRANRASQGTGILVAIRKWGTRILFIGAGIPLLGMTYTVALDEAAQMTNVSSGVSNATKILSGTLVDFESWALDQRLSLPANTTIKITTSSGQTSKGGTIDYSGTTNVRSIAMKVNSMTRNAGLPSNMGVDQDGTLTGTLGPGGTLPGDGGSTLTKNWSTDILNRYFHATTVSSADFETSYKKAVYTGSDEAARKTFYENITEKAGDRDYYNENDIFAQADSNQMQYMNDGNIASFNPEHGSIGGKESWISYTGSNIKQNADYGLSSMSLYNYLNSDFTDSGVIIGSPNKLSSDKVATRHYSVSLVGTGLFKVLYYLNALSVFAAIAIVGIGYSIALLINMIGRGVKMIINVPFALLGNLKGMARVVGYVFIMIIEILGTFFAYSIISEIILSLSSIIEAPLNERLSSVMSAVIPGLQAESLLMTNSASIITSLIITTLINVWFAIKALQIRSSMVKALDEMICGFIDRVFMVDTVGGAGSISSAPSAGSRIKNAAQTAGGAVASGAGAAIVKKALGYDTADDDASQTETGKKSVAVNDSSDNASGRGTQGIEDGEVREKAQVQQGNSSTAKRKKDVTDADIGRSLDEGNVESLDEAKQSKQLETEAQKSKATVSGQPENTVEEGTPPKEMPPIPEEAKKTADAPEFVAQGKPVRVNSGNSDRIDRKTKARAAMDSAKTKAAAQAQKSASAVVKPVQTAQQKAKDEVKKTAKAVSEALPNPAWPQPKAPTNEKQYKKLEDYGKKTAARIQMLSNARSDIASGKPVRVDNKTYRSMKDVNKEIRRLQNIQNSINSNLQAGAQFKPQNPYAGKILSERQEHKLERDINKYNSYANRLQSVRSNVARGENVSVNGTTYTSITQLEKDVRRWRAEAGRSRQKLESSRANRKSAQPGAKKSLNDAKRKNSV